jgi:hypothetical protein
MPEAVSADALASFRLFGPPGRASSQSARVAIRKNGIDASSIAWNELPIQVCAATRSLTSS